MMESVYHAELASGLEKAGHQIRYEGKSFELAHISRDQVEGFSKRSQDINAELAEMGQTRETASRALKQTIALRTRLDKAPEISREELQRDWERQAVELGVEFDSGKRPLDHGKDREQEAGGKPRRELTPEAAALIADECLRRC
ncbi:hypothetical protein G6F35_017443 [Rhizopus arrhizus]|nr:hypothetical protein G6F35_017443 [Rhizopus arrhizus]